MYRIIRESRLNKLNRSYKALMQQAREIRKKGDQNRFKRKMEEADIMGRVIARISFYTPVA